MLRKATQRNMTQQSGSNTTEIWPRGAKFTNQNGGGNSEPYGGGTNLLSAPHHDNTTCLNRSFFKENWLPRVGQLSGLDPT